MFKLASRTRWIQSLQCIYTVSSSSASAASCSHTTTTTIQPVFKRAHKFRDKVALSDQHGNHTYEHIHTVSERVAEMIQQKMVVVTGVGVSDAPLSREYHHHHHHHHHHQQERIAFLCPNDVSYLISQWGTWMAGHVAVPLYPRHPPSELQYLLRDSQACVIITTPEFSERVKQISSGQQIIVLDDDLFKPPSPSPSQQHHTTTTTTTATPSSSHHHHHHDPHFYSHSNAMILYTSGTTGSPKGVLLSHRNIESQVSCLLKAWNWTHTDTLLHCLPLHHTHGIINALLCPLYVGARVLMLPSFSPSEVWRHLLALDVPVEARVSVFMGVPTMYVKLLNEHHNHHHHRHHTHHSTKNSTSSSSSPPPPSSRTTKEYVRSVCAQNVRLMVSGSAALPESVLSEWYEVTGHVLLERYGMTEIGMALSNPLKGTRRPGFVGTPLPGVEVRIAKFSQGHHHQQHYQVMCEGNSTATTVTPGCEDECVGELLVRGENVFKEYWRNKEATLNEFTHDGWFKTGDTAQYKDGSYKILGRTSVDIIKSGGFKISALDVEKHLLTHPHITDVAVVGVPDLTWGQKVAAVVVWDGECVFDGMALREWCKERLPHYKVPSLVVPVKDALPRNAMGKVNKKQLIKEFFKDSASQS